MIARIKFVILLVLVLFASPLLAEDHRSGLRQEDLDQMLAPIALYPDALLSQILMASTYPLEVVQAARWSRDNPDLEGEAAVRAVESMDWDPSVKSLVAFPRVLAEMDRKLDWTQQLGEAFLAEQSRVMDTVQDLRSRAYAAGNLRSNEYYRVVPQGRTIVIESPYPDLIHVPYYDPLVVYGPWWWPAYPPVYWTPWPGYYAYPGAAGFYWGFGITIGTGFFFAAFDWPHHHVTVVHVGHPVFHHSFVESRRIIWKHDPDHRRGVRFRHAALREKFTPSLRSDFDARRDFRRRDPAPDTGSASLLQRRSDGAGSVPDRRPGMGRGTAADSQPQRATVDRRFVTEGGNRRRNLSGTQQSPGVMENRASGLTAPVPRRVQPDRPAADGRGAPVEPRATTERFREGGRLITNREVPRTEPDQTVPRSTGGREGMTARPPAAFSRAVPDGAGMREGVARRPPAAFNQTVPGAARMREGVDPPPPAVRSPALPMERSAVPGMLEGFSRPPSAGARDPGLRMERGNFRGDGGAGFRGGRGRSSPAMSGGRP